MLIPFGIFASSGAVSVPVEYLVVAGGGGGGSGHAGGGGAGGFRTNLVGATSGGGAAAENGLSIPSGINYTVTIGAGGAGSSSTSVKGTVGSNSIFSAMVVAVVVQETLMLD
jgi:hypothetical protein